jgi:regulator of RNase E activity RraA
MPARKTSKRFAPDAGLIRRLRRHASETISDVLDVMGLPNQVLAAGIRPVVPGTRLAGPAFCVCGRILAPGEPAASVQYAVDRALTKGCIVVVATGGYRGSAIIGGNIAASYRQRGAAGVVVDGAIRDPQEIRRLLPAFATHVTPRRPGGRWNVVAFGESISMPGQDGNEVIVHPGDFILGDGSGVVVIPRSIVGEVVEAADRLVPKEKKVLAAIRRGVDREQALKSADRYGHIRKIVPR